MIIFCTQIVVFTTVTECVSSNWIELLMEIRDLTLSVLMSVRAFLYCWLQILLGGIRQLLELGGKISKGESCELQEPPSDGTKSCLDTVLSSSRVKVLALHSV